GITDLPLKAQVFNLAYDNFLGRMGICRVYQGKIKNAQEVIAKDSVVKKIEDNEEHVVVDEEVHRGKITKLFTFEGFSKKTVNEAETGDIIMVAGLPDIFIGQT